MFLAPELRSPRSTSTAQERHMNKKRLIGYWITTSLVALGFFLGGTMDLLRPPELVENMQRLGYGETFMIILGLWKVLGAITILAPKLPRLKEWAYAGIVFDLTGAFVSHLAAGDTIGQSIAPVILLVLAGFSWALRPQSRKLEAPAAA